MRFAALPAGLTAITEETFLGTGFTAVILPDGVTEIADRAFADCPGLLYVRDPGRSENDSAERVFGIGQRLDRQGSGQ